MTETLGQKLKKARVARGLTAEDAAHATKIRAGRILDIEQDVYDNFTHITYARNFVLLYARFLGVDSTPYLEDFNTHSVIDVQEYQYLRETAPVAQIRMPEDHRRKPVLAYVGLALAGFAGLFCWFTYISVQRLGDIDVLAERQSEAGKPVELRSSTSAQPATAEIDRSPEEILSAEVESKGTARVHRIETETMEVSNSLPPAPVAVAPELPVRAPSLVEAAREPAPEPIGSDEVVLKPIRETWVTVTLNDPDATPVFDNFLRPGDDVLRFKGKVFWLFVNDLGSVEVRKNSELVQLTAKNSLIQ